MCLCAGQEWLQRRKVGASAVSPAHRSSARERKNLEVLLPRVLPLVPTACHAADSNTAGQQPKPYTLINSQPGMQPADKLLNADLLRRVEAVEKGAGRLFRVRTQVCVAC